MVQIDFWYSIGSTYSYLTVARLKGFAKAQGIDVKWRPFNVRHIMVEQRNIPFADKPEKTAYMWRDIKRRANMYNLPISVPAPYPIKNLALANQVALLDMREGWGQDYTVETYRSWFVDGNQAGSDPNLTDCLRQIGQDPIRVVALAESDDIVQALADETTIARDLGVFGSPSFLVGTELFWGDDRLDDAIAWAKHGHIPRGN